VFQKGDLVACRTFSGELLGIVLEIRQLSGIWKDSSCCSDPMYQVTVLFDSEVPDYVGTGRIGKVTDSILRSV